jgi:hypothetical protein
LTAFWIELNDVPLVCMNREIGIGIESIVGEVEVVGVGWGNFLGVKVVIDISKPLARGRFLTGKGKRV